MRGFKTKKRVETKYAEQQRRTVHDSTTTDDETDEDIASVRGIKVEPRQWDIKRISPGEKKEVTTDMLRSITVTFPPDVRE